MPEAITRYLLTHYVTVCERFNYATAESDYEECGAFHTAQRNQAWYALWNPNNPASPLNAYKDGTSVRAQVTSVSFFKRANGVGDLAQVRYVKAKRAAGSCDRGDDALDRHHPVRLRRSLVRSQDPRPGIRSGSRSWISRPEAGSPARSPPPAVALAQRRALQAQGIDAMRILMHVAGACACALPAFAETQPAPGLLDPRIRTAPYSADEVYRLVGFVGYQTDLEFESGRDFRGLGAGDIEGLSFVAQDNHLFLKPKAAKVGTNLTILTSRRTYQVDYSATRRAAGCDGGSDVRPAVHLSAGHTRGGRDAASSALDAALTGRATSTTGSAGIRPSNPPRPPMMACIRD